MTETRKIIDNISKNYIKDYLSIHNQRNCRNFLLDKYKITIAIHKQIIKENKEIVDNFKQQENKEFISKKFGKLQPIEKIIIKSKPIKYLCLCDCGNKKIITKSHLLQGKSNSCGCRHKQTGENSVHWKGFKEISLAYWNQIQNGATSRGIKFDIKIEDIWNLYLKQNKTCALSGIPIQFKSRYDITDGTASLDRINSDKDYTIDNVQWVHKDINKMKMDFPQEYFLSLIRKIHSYSCDSKAKI